MTGTALSLGQRLNHLTLIAKHYEVGTTLSMTVNMKRHLVHSQKYQ